MQYVINLYTSLIVKVLYIYEFLQYTKILHITLNIILKKWYKSTDKNITQKLIKYAQKATQSVNIILHNYDIYSKNRHKTDISKFLKIVKFEGLKK